MTTGHEATPAPAGRSPQPRRAGHVCGQVLVLIACGLLAGAADSWLRPVKLAATDPAGGVVPAPQPTDPAPAPTPTPAEVPGPGPADSAPKAAPAQPTGTNPPAAAADAPLALHINLAQARKLFERGTPFLDARTEEEFRAGHIAGAFHLPSDAFDRPGGAEALKFLDQNAPVVIYCGGGDCHASEYVAIRLEQAGFKSYHIMTDGFPSWQAAGYDTATGEQ